MNQLLFGFQETNSQDKARKGKKAPPACGDGPGGGLSARNPTHLLITECEMIASVRVAWKLHGTVWFTVHIF